MEQMITNLGFPIACVVAMGGAMFLVIKYFLERDKASREDMNKIIDNMRSDSKEDRQLYKETIDKFDEKLDRFGITLEQYSSKLGQLEGDIKDIKSKVGA